MTRPLAVAQMPLATADFGVSPADGTLNIGFPNADIEELDLDSLTNCLAKHPLAILDDRLTDPIFPGNICLSWP